MTLCRDVYHCLPGELDKEDWDRIETHLTCMDVEAKVRKHENQGPKEAKR